MNLRSVLMAANVGCLLLAIGAEAGAAELKLITAAATRTLMAGLGPKFEQATGHTLAVTVATAGDAVLSVSPASTPITRKA